MLILSLGTIILHYIMEIIFSNDRNRQADNEREREAERRDKLQQRENRSFMKNVYQFQVN